jgi:signal transduction histidine kinase
VLEALTNVARHAHADLPHPPELREAQVLYLEVTDDGSGLSKDYHAGSASLPCASARWKWVGNAGLNLD